MRRGGIRYPFDWTDREVDLLRRFYAASKSAPVNLQNLAQLLGRNKANVCRKARSLGLTNQGRAKGKQLRLDIEHTKEGSPEYRRRMSDARRRSIAKHGHPRGALGMKHTDATKAALSEKSKRAWADPNSGLNSESTRQLRSDAMSRRNAATPAEHSYSRCARGRRPDLGSHFFRSSWEANYARYLNFMKGRGDILSWEYEPHTFWFEAIRRGVRSYMPDFKVTLASDGRIEWHEVKGWMDAKSRTKLSRMAKYFPHEVVRVIGPDWFRQAIRGGLASLLPGWERAGRKHASGTKGNIHAQKANR